MVDPASIGGLGAIGASIWLWRVSKVAKIFKILSVASIILVGANLLGVVSIDVHPDAALGLARAAWDLGQRVIGA